MNRTRTITRTYYQKPEQINLETFTLESLHKNHEQGRTPYELQSLIKMTQTSRLDFLWKLHNLEFRAQFAMFSGSQGKFPLTRFQQQILLNTVET